MAWHPIYLGEKSCYCKKTGVCVQNIEKPGVDTIQEAVNILKFIALDVKKGWTFDHYCNVIPMDKTKAIRRANFLLLLAKKHGMNEKDYEKLREMVKYFNQKVKEIPQIMVIRTKNKRNRLEF